MNAPMSLKQIPVRLSPDGREVRSGLARGRYLFFNPLLRAGMRIFDALSGLGKRLDRPLPATLAPQRVLLCMQAHIGDLIYASAAIPVVQAAFPDARIDFLVHPAARKLVDGHPAIGCVLEVTHWRLDRSPRPLWRKLLAHWREQAALQRSLRAHRYDLAIDLYAYFPNSIPLLHAARVPVRLGWASGGFGGLLTHARDWHGNGQHVLSWHRALLAAVPACRAHLDALAPSLAGLEKGRVSCRTQLEAAGVGGAYLAFHIGAGSPHRQWNEADWITLAQACQARGRQVVVLGFGAAESALAERIAHAAPGCVSLAGRLDFDALRACIDGATALVGLDSMASHLAVASGTPAIGIYAGVSDKSWRPANPRSLIVTTPMPCAPCYLPNGCSSMACLRRTSASAVLAALESLLQKEAARERA